jgi:hypothetical protein
LAGFRGGVAAWGDGTAGLALGVLLGLGLSRFPGPKRGLGLILGPACVGLFLGWKAALVLTPVAALLWLPLCALGRAWPALERLTPTIWLLLLALAWVLAWGQIASYWPILGEPLF